ncbi:MAG: hypothetical protein ACK4UJ_06775 [Leptonema sp. (in: bacteria)]
MKQSKNIQIILLILLLIFVLPRDPSAQEVISSKFSYSYLWEILIPGYNFYKKDEVGWGNFFLIIRAFSLYSAFQFHGQYLSYKSLERAAKYADFYYGLGYSYKDPIRGGYKTTKEFSIEAGRSASYRNLSIGIQLIFLGIGLYKGYQNSWEEYIQSVPEYKIHTFNLEFQDHRISVKNTIRLDF